MYRYIIIAATFLLPLQVAAGEHPTAFELLDKFAETQDKLKSFILKYEDEYSGRSKISFMPGREKPRILNGGYVGEVRSDGHKHYNREKGWGKVRPDLPQSKELVESDPRYLSHLWDGENQYQYMRSNKRAENDILFLVLKGHKRARGDWIIETQRSRGLFGYFEDTFAKAPDDFERIDVELRQAHSISVQQQMEQVSGSKCYVINAKTKNGRHKIWIDPEHSHNIAKAEIFRKWQGPDIHKPEEISLFTYLRNVRFKMVDDVWVTVEADYGSNWKLIKQGYLKEDHHHKIIDFILNPDHAALGSFGLDYIRNGTGVSIIGIKGTQYTWQDGKVVDKKGRAVFDSKSKKSLKK